MYTYVAFRTLKKHNFSAQYLLGRGNIWIWKILVHIQIGDVSKIVFFFNIISILAYHHPGLRWAVIKLSICDIRAEIYKKLVTLI